LLMHSKTIVLGVGCIKSLLDEVNTFFPPKYLQV
jgi:hypothetical protein